MPIYAYRCAACGHAKDVLQKMSDAPLTVCPSCAAPRFEKQVTAAGFQLKGSGWYVTDFREGAAKKGDKTVGTAANRNDGEAKPASDSASATPVPVPSPAPAPAASPAPSPAAAPPPSSSSSS